MPSRNPPTSSQKNRKSIGPFVAIFFGRIFPLLFMAVGIVATIGGSRSLRYGLASTSWPTAEATVVHTDIEQDYDPGGGSTTGDYSFDITIRYTYAADGVEYTNDQVSFPEVLPSARSDAEKVVRRYLEGSTVPVSYNPEDPGVSVLEPGTSFYSWLGPIFGLVFFFAGLIMAGLIPAGIKEHNARLRNGEERPGGSGASEDGEDA